MKTATMLDARVGKYFVRCEEHNSEMVKQTLVKNSHWNSWIRKRQKLHRFDCGGHPGKQDSE